MNPSFGFADFSLIGPEIACAGAAILVLALDMLFRSQRSKRLVEAVAAGGLALAAFLAAGRLGQAPAEAFAGLVADGKLANLFRLGLASTGLLTLVLARHQGRSQGLLHAEFYALLLFALGGMMLLAVSQDLMLAFIALETFSLAMYVLAGFNKGWHGNREAAIKYFLLGAFAAAFFLLGLALVYGSAASSNLKDLAGLLSQGGLAPERSLLLQAGLALCLSAFAFKLGAAPFHLWVPDVYAGATTPVSAFLSAGAKLAGLAALLRLLGVVPAAQAPYPQIIAALALLTLLAGNLGALRQENVKRLLAYSSVAHTGYALVALLGLGSPGSGAEGAALAYALTYGLMSLLAFALAGAAEEGLEPVDGGRALLLGDLQGLGFERPVYGLLLAVAMVALAGLPPTAGFAAKLGVFKAALAGGHAWVAGLAILNSVVSAAVYLRVLVALYMLPKGARSAQPRLGFGLGLLCACLALGLLALGLMPAPLAALASL